MYDICLRPHASRGMKERQLLLKRCMEMGWRCIAWNQNVIGKVSTSTKVNHNIVTLDSSQVAEALVLRSLAADEDDIKLPIVRQLHRVTVIIDEVIDAQSLTSSNDFLRSFDIVAASPGNESVFAYLCNVADIDLISFDFSHRLPFSLNKKLIDSAISRGIYFEICYCSVISSSAHVRREVFSGTRVLIQYLRGRNIIMSSGADNISVLRGPLDVTGIGEALKLSREHAAKTISDNCAQMLRNSFVRRRRNLPLELLDENELYAKFPEVALWVSQTPLGPRSDSSIFENDESETNDIDAALEEGKCGNTGKASSKDTIAASGFISLSQMPARHDPSRKNMDDIATATATASSLRGDSKRSLDLHASTEKTKRLRLKLLKKR